MILWGRWGMMIFGQLPPHAVATAARGSAFGERGSSPRGRNGNRPAYPPTGAQTGSAEPSGFGIDSARSPSLTGVLQKPQTISKQPVNAYTQAVRLDPENEYAWFNLARLQCALGDTSQAIASISKTVELAPIEPVYRAYRANWLIARGDLLGASDDLAWVGKRRHEAHGLAFQARRSCSGSGTA